jgi:hypothetical protein
LFAGRFAAHSRIPCGLPSTVDAVDRAMISEEDNELLTCTGPGTLMGDLMR